MIGEPRIHHEVTDSTNERARELAGAGAAHGTLVTAGEQTAGRGRQGRSWTAAPGEALLMSVIVRDLEPRHALLPLMAALAVCEAAEAVADVELPDQVAERRLDRPPQAERHPRRGPPRRRLGRRRHRAEHRRARVPTGPPRHRNDARPAEPRRRPATHCSPRSTAGSPPSPARSSPPGAPATPWSARPSAGRTARASPAASTTPARCSSRPPPARSSRSEPARSIWAGTSL